MVPQSGSHEFMVAEQRNILLLLLEIYHAITLLQGPISSHFGVVTSRVFLGHAYVLSPYLDKYLSSISRMRSAPRTLPLLTTPHLLPEAWTRKSSIATVPRS
jgi:hypothetical protein